MFSGKWENISWYRLVYSAKKLSLICWFCIFSCLFCIFSSCCICWYCFLFQYTTRSIVTVVRIAVNRFQSIAISNHRWYMLLVIDKCKSCTNNKYSEKPLWIGRNMTESVYKIIELVGSSPISWEEAANNAVAKASESLRDLRICEVVKLDTKIESGKIVAYRARVQLSFKYSEE